MRRSKSERRCDPQKPAQFASGEDSLLCLVDLCTRFLGVRPKYAASLGERRAPGGPGQELGANGLFKANQAPAHDGF
jgi:hypothetical protein